MTVWDWLVVLVSTVTGWLSPDGQLRQEEGRWLRASQASLREGSVACPVPTSRWIAARPAVLAIAVALLGWLLCFVAWW